MRSMASIDTTPSEWLRKCGTTKQAITRPVINLSRRSMTPIFLIRESLPNAKNGVCPHLTLELQRLVLEKLFQAVHARLAAVPRLLEAAERRVHVERPSVHVDLPGADAPRDALRARVVLRPHGAGGAVD